MRIEESAIAVHFAPGTGGAVTPRHRDAVAADGG